MLIIYSCVTHCPQTSLLKVTTNIYYPIAYVGWAPGCGLPGPLAQGPLPGCTQGVSWGCTAAKLTQVAASRAPLASLHSSSTDLLLGQLSVWQVASIRASESVAKCRQDETHNLSVISPRSDTPSFLLHCIHLLGPAHAQRVGIIQGHEYQEKSD